MARDPSGNADRDRRGTAAAAEGFHKSLTRWLVGARFCLVAMWTAAGPAAIAAERSTAGSPAVHWAFRPIGSNAIPRTRANAWARNSVDAFVLARLEDAGLSPSPLADRLALVRRLYLDLIGLPPSPEEVKRVTSHEPPDAYERLIDRLLASPAHGERWGRHWLDVARYADTGGFEADLLYPRAWRFRDYVIRCLNHDKPYNRFVQEQVAGDELWPEQDDATTGTGLFCIGPALAESAMVGAQLEQEWLTDAVDTIGAALLGLTVGCARCHDHKYDPITQRDYYALQAVFAASDRPFPEKVRLNRIKAINGLLSETPLPASLLNDPRCTVRTEDEVGFRLFHRPEPLTVHRLRRGELGRPLEKVGPALPACLLVADSVQASLFSGVSPSKRRAALAGWLVSPENPLVARVLVNRVWAWHFGHGLVRTPSDFGTQGEPPTHPELLDWLARDLIEHGWSLKRLHRLIVTSSTYRMSSIAAGAGLRTDPENRLLWYFPRRRLEGEAIRDAMLSCSGQLNSKPFGPPVVAPLGKDELTGLFDARSKWPVTPDASEHARRSIYLLVRRTFAYPLFSAFDPPDVMTSCARRLPTIVPTQALALLNSPVARQQAAAFAARLRAECGDHPERQVTQAWILAFGRPPAPDESKHAVQLIRGAAFNAHTASSEAGVLERLCLALFNANEFVWID
jgi:hypothetical protein